MRQQVNDGERIEVDAMIHDHVLTTLLSAANAQTLEAEALAARMAADALHYVAVMRKYAPYSATASIPSLGKRIKSAARSLGNFTVRVDTTSNCQIPDHIAEALYSAASQAMINSLHHASSPDRNVQRSVNVNEHNDGRITVEVIDDGIGFDINRVAPERMGLRFSIQERITRIGGHVNVTSHPGHGTRILITWPETLNQVDNSWPPGVKISPLLAVQNFPDNEHTLRLHQMHRLAAPTLQQIAMRGGHLTKDERQECRIVEATVRDEIRGRTLLNDNVRQEIIAARRRGTEVILLDDGDIDNLPPKELNRVLRILSEAIRDIRTEKLLVRSVPENHKIAVTVVALSSTLNDETNTGLHGGNTDEDHVDLWLEIPRSME
jgi:hypothetical protein